MVSNQGHNDIIAKNRVLKIDGYNRAFSLVDSAYFAGYPSALIVWWKQGLHQRLGRSNDVIMLLIIGYP